MCEICSKLTIKIPEHHCRHCRVFISNFKHFTQCYGVSIADFEQLNSGWNGGKYLPQVNKKET